MFFNLVLDRVRLRLPDGRSLFPAFSHSVSHSVSQGPVGLVGRNGCGKSSLLRALAGHRVVDEGSVSVSGRITLFDQHAPAAEATLAEALGVADQLACLARLLAGDGSVDDAAEADWMLEDRLHSALQRVGLPADLDLSRPVGTLSGGEQMRLGLARLWLDRPDILLLDEPTNNLDADGCALITQLVTDWPGLVLVASHDRALLEHMAEIIELTEQAVHVTGGGWSEHQAAQEARRLRAEQALDKAQSSLQQQQAAAQATRQRAERHAAKGRTLRKSGGVPHIVLNQWRTQSTAAAGKSANQAARQTRQAEQAVEQAQAEVERLTPLRFDLPPCYLPAGREVLRLSELSCQVADRQLFSDLNLCITGPERLAITGANGTGKSTLLRLIAGQLDPQSGQVNVNQARLGYLDQQLQLLDRKGTVLDNLLRLAPDLTPARARDHAARFAFRSDRALQQVSTLSGGEQLRAALACLFARSDRPQLLMLDEPTNHLDITARQELESTLAGWDGALIVVSHDPAFLDAIGVSREVRLD